MGRTRTRPELLNFFILRKKNIGHSKAMEEITKNLSGTSLLVPSVQELAKEKISNVPQRYIQPQHEEDIVILSEEANSSLEIPVIDMQSLLSEESGSSELDKLHLACKEWGFFQVSFFLFILQFLYSCKSVTHLSV